MDKIERLKFTIQRIDHYYSGVNFKGSFFLGVNTFLLGGCLASLQSDSLDQIGLQVGINFLLIALTSLLSIAYVLWAILPFLKNGKSYDYESLIFFGSIAEMDFGKFNSNLEKTEEDEFEKDLTRQIHTLSVGLKKKFLRIRTAGITLFISILLSISFFYQIINC